MGFKEAGITLDDCKDYAFWFNERRNKPPLPDAEVERTVKVVYERYQDQKSVRQFSDTIYSHQTEKLNLDTFDYATVLKKGIELKNLEIKVEWLIDSILPKQSITLLHGRGGIGKTWLSMMIGDMVSRGRNFFGRKVNKYLFIILILRTVCLC